MSSSDERLALRLVRGEETALGELYDRFAPLVHGLALCVLDDQDAAEQLTRDVFAQVWSEPGHWHPGQGTLRSWLGTLTHRRAVERLREGCGDEREIDARSASALAHHAVASLPDPLRETIAPGHHDGRTYRDTARRLGISDSAAKHRMRLGLQLVAGELAGARRRPEPLPAAGRPGP
ncbi:RNA polymerase sigma-70 factor (ECF subfamily) [Streptomyces sp. TLI_235]|nr:sigma factor [Streptomyces sp. TLI_235]PBC78238.1 RNA polymerase sigma-70 factor (ECF subfamily) [Streptomyces sp. TLI_235]